MAVFKRAGSSLYDDDDDLPPPAAKKLADPTSSLYDSDEQATGQANPEAAKVVESSSTENGSSSTTPFQDKHKAVSEQKGKVLLSALGARQGEREDMQDSHLQIDSFNIGKDFITRSAIYGIYDGHAGPRAAQYCEKLLPELLKKKLSSLSDLPSMEKSLKRIFTETYKAIDEIFLREARKGKPVWKDGTTATTAFILNDAIYVANVGDSRAIVCREKPEEGKLSALQLTVDHNPLVYEERMRIQNAGGVVKDGRINGVIEVSRSIGDGQFKTLGVTCIPDMKKLTITPNDKFLLIGCDGVWKAFDNDEAIKFVADDLEKKYPTKEPRGVSSDGRSWQSIALSGVAERLAAESVRRGCGDNVSVLVVLLQ